MNKLKSAVLVGAVLASAGAGILAGAGGAGAEGTATPWASGPNHDPNAVGGIQFFDAAGNKITTGSTNTAPFSKYAVGTTVLHSGDDTATLFFYQPSAGSQDTWTNNDQLGLSTPYPNAAAPEPVKSTTLPTNTENSSDTKLDSEVANYGATPVTGYENVYQIRLYSSSAASGVAAQYDYADVSINSANHTWSLVYTPDPPPPPSTTSTLTTDADPSGVAPGTTVTLTDTISPPNATGSVQFKDGTANVGGSVPVSGGKAVKSFAPTTPGSHSITAVFMGSGLPGFGSSTSNPETVKVLKPSCTIGLASNPTSAKLPGAVFHLTAAFTTCTTTGKTGTVSFKANGAQIGTADMVNSSAALDYSPAKAGDFSITATFTPTDPNSYDPASAGPVMIHVDPSDCPTCIDEQSIDADVAAGSLAITTPYHQGNPLHVGTLALNADGTSLSGSAQFGDGTTPDGSIKVVDTRAGNANWTASAQSSDLVNGSDSINSQNVGLTGLKGIYLTGNALQAGSLAFTDNAAANPAVAPGATGTKGLGNAAHQFARTTAGGDGTVGIYGTLTINAPTSTQPGHYAGTVTFTVIGS